MIENLDFITVKEIVAFITGGGAVSGGTIGVVALLLRVIPKMHLEKLGANLADVVFDLFGKNMRSSASEGIFPTLIKFIEAFASRWMLKCANENSKSKEEK